ncbi:MAG: DsbA family oxidoreductase [Alphaproteobacteria bacterium]|nr:disulfide bond formation protein DsbA [Rhodobiaceae bacterium]MBO6542139.1 DsbA family oxidoreductase [Alphaproteobacteria bacterium]MBO6629706.1 DsbA family oxidoreductase [Alphaproteobacteria bacterium]MDF1625003.1 DsbA family oxidoreductase [Parvibaculaceae bacterium]
MQLDVISDTVCPWCYIGKKRLDRAMAAWDRKDVTIAVDWRPYQLDPTIPAEGVDRQKYMEKKFGTERAKSAGKVIAEYGEMEGINFAFDKIKRSPNTLDSHRLVKWAGSAGKQLEAVELLFKRYFEDGADVGSHGVLLEVAADIGMDKDQVRNLLESDTDRQVIEYEDHMAREMGVTGVPFFLFEKKFSVVGAQEVDTLTKVFTRVQERLVEGAAS